MPDMPRRSAHRAGATSSPLAGSSSRKSERMKKSERLALEAMMIAGHGEA